jgi:tripartite-type tricarboxylate transporter receptor subunit TctC
MIGWYGIAAPAGTPPAIVSKLHTDIAAVLLAPETRERLAAEGGEAVASKPEEFGAFIKSEIAKFGKVVKAAKIPMQ